MDLILAAVVSPGEAGDWCSITAAAPLWRLSIQAPRYVVQKKKKKKKMQVACSAVSVLSVSLSLPLPSDVYVGVRTTVHVSR